MIGFNVWGSLLELLIKTQPGRKRSFHFFFFSSFKYSDFFYYIYLIIFCIILSPLPYLIILFFSVTLQSVLNLTSKQLQLRLSEHQTPHILVLATLDWLIHSSVLLLHIQTFLSSSPHSSKISRSLRLYSTSGMFWLHQHRRCPRRLLNQMPEAPQLTPLGAKDQPLLLQTPVDVWAPSFSPLDESCIVCLYSFSHDPWPLASFGTSPVITRRLRQLLLCHHSDIHSFSVCVL